MQSLHCDSNFPFAEQEVIQSNRFNLNFKSYKIYSMLILHSILDNTENWREHFSTFSPEQEVR